MAPLLIVALVLFQAVISLRTELVAVPVTVTDDRGRQVRDLTQDNFRVLEDGRPQPVTVFHQGDGPITLGLIVDRSQSMRSKSRALLTAVSAVLKSARPDDELFGVGFHDDVEFAAAGAEPFTSDPRRLEAALSAIPNTGMTALYDGVAAGLDRLRSGRFEHKVLIVISDGGDNASTRTFADVVTLARRTDAVIYAIGLLGTDGAGDEEDSGLIKRLCKDTGGVAYFPKSTEELIALSTRVALDIREQYTLGFAPGATDGRQAFRRIEVIVSAKAHGRLHVRTRSGYIVAP
ncbi:MAG: VWA domain-containing protein [Vicinamibacterales bacterium]